MWVYYVNVFHFFLVIFHLSFLKNFPDFYHRFLNPRFFSQIFPPIFLIPPLYQYNFDSFVYFDTFLRFIDSICNGYVYVKFMCAIVDLEGKVQLILGTKLFRIFHSPQFFQFLKFFLIEIIFFQIFVFFDQNIRRLNLHIWVQGIFDYDRETEPKPYVSSQFIQISNFSFFFRLEM